MASAVASVVLLALSENPSGNVLCFLPGAGDIWHVLRMYAVLTLSPLLSLLTNSPYMLNTSSSCIAKFCPRTHCQNIFTSSPATPCSHQTLEAGPVFMMCVEWQASVLGPGCVHAAFPVASGCCPCLARCRLRSRMPPSRATPQASRRPYFGIQDPSVERRALYHLRLCHLVPKAGPVPSACSKYYPDLATWAPPDLPYCRHAGARRVILATDIAESSLTISGASWRLLYALPCCRGTSSLLGKGEEEWAQKVRIITCRTEPAAHDAGRSGTE